MRFSQRIGKEPVETDLQVDTADTNLRVAVWNVIYRYLIDDPWAVPRPTYHEEYLHDTWEFYFKFPLDEEPEARKMIPQLKQWVLGCDWYLIYDFIEFFLTVLPGTVIKSFETTCNKALESERSAYRIVRSAVVPITDAVEVKEVTHAAEKLGKHGLKGARDHLAAALTELGKRKEPDYDLAILEALRAVRETVRLVLHDPDTDLSGAFAQLDPENLLPDRFKQGVEALFSVGENIDDRHLFRDSQVQPGLDEARFMVVSASALVNYLLAIAREPRVEGDEPEGPKQITAPE